jgi:leucyl aminopeptidase
LPLTIDLARTTLTDVGATAIGAVRGQTEGGDVDWAHLAGLGFEAKKGDVRAVPGREGGTTFVVGLGPAAEVDANVLRFAAGSLARAAKRHASLAVDLLGNLAEGTSPAAGAQAVAEGLVLGGYQFSTFKSEPKPAELSRIVLVGGGGKRTEAAIQRGLTLAEAVCWARDLENEPGGSLTPDKLAKAAAAEGTRAGFEVTVWGEKEIRQEKLGGLLGVNRGSEQKPRFLRLEYAPDKPRGTVALVGKGITFDSGGLSIKTGQGMMTMKGDMGGAAAVLGAMSVLPDVAPQCRVRAFIPMTDNMTGGDATRPGDVLRIRNGKTIEVLNTDAEGRLVLADALSIASEAKPDAIVDLATLTGACMVALGMKIAGLMGNNEGLIEQVQAAATATGERVWPLPLPPDYRKLFESPVADMKNIGTPHGGALTAGLILQEFVAEGIAWAHLDIAGPAFSDADEAETSRGGTGFGVRLLVELASKFQKPT